MCHYSFEYYFNLDSTHIGLNYKRFKFYDDVETSVQCYIASRESDIESNESIVVSKSKKLKIVCSGFQDENKANLFFKKTKNAVLWYALNSYKKIISHQSSSSVPTYNQYAILQKKPERSSEVILYPSNNKPHGIVGSATFYMTHNDEETRLPMLFKEYISKLKLPDRFNLALSIFNDSKNQIATEYQLINQVTVLEILTLNQNVSELYTTFLDETKDRLKAIYDTEKNNSVNIAKEYEDILKEEYQSLNGSFGRLHEVSKSLSIQRMLRHYKIQEEFTEYKNLLKLIKNAYNNRSLIVHNGEMIPKETLITQTQLLNEVLIKLFNKVLLETVSKKDAT